MTAIGPTLWKVGLGRDGIVVIEELTQCADFQDAPGQEKIDAKIFSNENFWGNYFFHHDAEKDSIQKNYFVKKVSENSRYAMPSPWLDIFQVLSTTEHFPTCFVKLKIDLYKIQRND